MNVIPQLRSMLLGRKKCGCSQETGNHSEYQFRVRRATEQDAENLFQIREKRTCAECGEQEIDVHIEDVCEYDPHRSTHTRKVGIDEEDMVDYGFMPRSEFVKHLIEMRLSHALNV